jgi:hypothetical protein
MTKPLKTASDFWCKNLSLKPSLLVAVVEQWLSRLIVRLIAWKSCVEKLGCPTADLLAAPLPEPNGAPVFPIRRDPFVAGD